MKINKPASGLAAAAVLSLATAGIMAPGAASAESVDGDIQITNTETVSVLMGADGSIDAQRVYDQLVFSGRGSVDVSNPVSTEGLRNLDGFGGWSVADGAQRIKTDVNGEQRYRSVSDFTGDLPVSVDVEYTLNGKKVEPGEVVGERGTLEVRYTVTNLTGKQQDVTFTDGEGNTKTVQKSVVIPLVGSMSTVLPSNFTEVRSDEANAAGDGKGGTQLSFTMTLFPPIGSDRATFGYTAKIADGVIPEAAISLLPVNPLESPSFKGGAASYQGGADSGADLTAGAVEIDQNVLKLRDGANDLVDGLLQLRDGANELNAGLSGKAAPGARELASGAGDLDAGAKKLNDGAGRLNSGAGELGTGAGQVDDGAKQLRGGAGRLSGGSKKVEAGAGELDAGVAELQAGAGLLDGGLADANSKVPGLSAGAIKIRDGLEKVDAGLGQLHGQVGGGLNQINAGAVTLIAALETQLIPGLQQAEAALANASALANSLEDSLPQKANLLALIGGANGGVGQVRAGLSGQVLDGAVQTRDGSAQLIAGLDAQLSENAGDGTVRFGVKALRAGVVGELIPGIDALSVGIEKLSAGASELAAGTGELKAGSSALAAGSAELSSGAGELLSGTKSLSDGTGRLSSGAGDLAEGARELASGTGTLSDGTGKLSAGAAELSSGLGDAASGSGRLAEGLETAAGSAPALPEGAQELSDKGTSQLVNVGNGTAMDYGLKYALIEASAARAASAQPYGSPADASGLTAYKFELASADGEGSANGTRGVAAVVLGAAALGLMGLRRRGVFGS